VTSPATGRVLCDEWNRRPGRPPRDRKGDEAIVGWDYEPRGPGHHQFRHSALQRTSESTICVRSPIALPLRFGWIAPSRGWCTARPSRSPVYRQRLASPSAAPSGPSSGWWIGRGCGCSQGRCGPPRSPPAGVLPIWRRPSGPSPNRECRISGSSALDQRMTSLWRGAPMGPVIVRTVRRCVEDAHDRPHAHDAQPPTAPPQGAAIASSGRRRDPPPAAAYLRSEPGTRRRCCDARVRGSGPRTACR
jgi:hypothetical protein